MLAPIPYADVAGYKRRSKIVPTDIDLCASLFPGYIEHRIAAQSSRINSRLKKRYRVPLGQDAPLLVAQGTAPPPIALSGRPVLGSLEVSIQVTGYAAPTVSFTWSSDGGLSSTAGAVAAPGSFTLSGTGIVAAFGPGPYATDNLYEASTPVPEIALGWLAALVDVDVWQKRGVNPQDPQIDEARAERDQAIEEIKEAADSEDGLFDLPTTDAAGDSAVTQGGPMSYSEQSPYVWQDIQVGGGVADDRARQGDFGSVDR